MESSELNSALGSSPICANRLIVNKGTFFIVSFFLHVQTNQSLNFPNFNLRETVAMLVSQTNPVGVELFSSFFLILFQ